MENRVIIQVSSTEAQSMTEQFEQLKGEGLKVES